MTISIFYPVNIKTILKLNKKRFEISKNVNDDDEYETRNKLTVKDATRCRIEQKGLGGGSRRGNIYFTKIALFFSHLLSQSVSYHPK